MALSIKSNEADHLARELSERTGETITQTVVIALRERLERERTKATLGLVERLQRLAEDVARLPTLDGRSADAIIGYDEHGLPA